MKRASQKQIDYINAICEELNIDKPENLSMHSASIFISSNVNAFKKAKMREKMKTKIIHRNNVDEQPELFARGRRGLKHITLEQSIDNVRKAIIYSKFIRKQK